MYFFISKEQQFGTSHTNFKIESEMGIVFIFILEMLMTLGTLLWAHNKRKVKGRENGVGKDNNYECAMHDVGEISMSQIKTNNDNNIGRTPKPKLFNLCLFKEIKKKKTNNFGYGERLKGVFACGEMKRKKKC